MDALVDSSSAIARSTSSCVPRPAVSSCCVSSDALSWLATLSRATASRACVPLTSVYASTTSAATETRVRRRSDRSRAKSARAPAIEARRAPKTSTSQLASTPASNRFDVGRRRDADLRPAALECGASLRRGASSRPPARAAWRAPAAPAPSLDGRRGFDSAPARRATSCARPGTLSTTRRRAPLSRARRPLPLSNAAGGVGATGLMSVPLTLQPAIATNSSADGRMRPADHGWTSPQAMR